MTTQMALELVRQQAVEGKFEHVTLIPRYALVAPNSRVPVETLPGATTYAYILSDGGEPGIRVESDRGVYDTVDLTLSELIEVHEGSIQLVNSTALTPRPIRLLVALFQ